MFKQAGLSLCLCLMAVVSNCLFTSHGGSLAAQQGQAHSVTTGPTTLVVAGGNWGCDGLQADRLRHGGKRPCSP